MAGSNQQLLDKVYARLDKVYARVCLQVYARLVPAGVPPVCDK
jgi:hypothetical protein